MRLLLLKLFIIVFLSPRVPSLFLFNLRGCSKNRFSQVYVLTSYFSFSVNILRNIIISKWNKHSFTRRGNIGDIENSYPNLVSLEADFWKLNISSSFALEVLSSWALTWNSSASSFFVLSVRKFFSNHKAPMVWFVSSNFVKSSSQSSSTLLSFFVASLYSFSCFSET